MANEKSFVSKDMTFKNNPSESSYKIAAVTQDGATISSHFGMAPAYRVFTIAGGEIVAEEERLKPHHGQHPDHSSHQGHGHDDMFAPVSDCRVLLCGGMGQPAFEKAQQAGLELILTGGDIRTAVQAYLGGQVQTDLRRIHRH